MGFYLIMNTSRKYSFAIISVIFMICNDSVTMQEVSQEDLDSLLDVFDRPLEKLKISKPTANIPVVPTNAGGLAGGFSNQGLAGGFSSQGLAGGFSNQGGLAGGFSNQGQPGGFSNQGQAGGFLNQGQAGGFINQGLAGGSSNQGGLAGGFSNQGQPGGFSNQGQAGGFLNQGQAGGFSYQGGLAGGISSPGGLVGGFPNQGLAGGFSNQQLAGGFSNQELAGGPSKQGCPYQGSVAKIPGIEDILAFGEREEFSALIPKHAKLATKLIDIFLGAENFERFKFLFKCLRNDVNPSLYMHALTVALMHRPDTGSFPIPNLVKTFPYQFFNKEVFLPLSQQLATNDAPRTPIELSLDRTGTNLEREHRVAYWREDIALNLHHLYWHLAYPSEGCPEIVDKDRRGELFYYMHRQIISRYNFERLSNNLERVEKLSNWYAPIKEAYFPRLDNLIAKGIYPSRPSSLSLDDVQIADQDIYVDVANIVRLRDRIFKAIDLGYAVDANGEKVILDNITGIDILGNMVESSNISINSRYYGNLHSSGHLLLAFIHDPKSYHRESMGVMGDVATAMRDPVFYRWHSFVDDIFTRFKDSLPPYTVEQLTYPGVKLTHLNIRTEGELYANVLRTFWNRTYVNLTKGVDFSKGNGTAWVGYTHLDHQNFNYEMIVENEDQEIKRGIFRIFMSPKYDESQTPWKKFVAQRHMFIELDKFEMTLKPGRNFIFRSSVDSSVTIPFNETIPSYDKREPEKNRKYFYSGCGWPHHLLLPMGAEHGFHSQLFVMISDYYQDKVTGSEYSPNESYCGVFMSKYPDKQAMGFPFDRLPRENVNTLQQFLTPNMFVLDCVIIHTNVVVENNISNQLNTK